jgi:hypothetical protein
MRSNGQVSGRPTVRVGSGMTETTTPDPKTIDELKAALIAEVEAEAGLPLEEIGRQPSVLDSPLAMRLWDQFLRR